MPGVNPDDRLIRLETRLAYLEQTLDALDGVVITHDRTIERLTRQLAQLRNELAAGSRDAVEPEGEEPPPPHY